MPTPKMTPAQIAELRKHADAYLEAHRDGGYADNSIAMREGGLRYFIAYLEGKYDPATDKGHFNH